MAGWLIIRFSVVFWEFEVLGFPVLFNDLYSIRSVEKVQTLFVAEMVR